MSAAQILIVDDDPIQRLMARDMLERGGYDCFEAEDGDVALKALGGRSADLVVTDIFMPNREGIETIREIKKQWPELPVIAVSSGWNAVSADQVLRMAKVLGADAALTKPLEELSFQALVDDLLGPKRAAR